MTRIEISLLTGCLLGLVVYTSNAWTQDGPESAQERVRGQQSADEARPEKRIPGTASTVRVREEGSTKLFIDTDSGAVVGMQRGGTRPKTISRTITETVMEPVAPEELEEFQAFQQAKQSLKDAKDDGDRKKAAETIKQHLEKQFERDLAQRQQDLAAVEERVKLLRQQLSKRQTAKDEIIALRLKTIVNSAEGLGFPGDEGPQIGPSNLDFSDNLELA